jgi:adenylate kinase family enzyme
MKKVAIIGCAGAGKSTLALQLHTHLKLPVYHLDKYYWKPQWLQPDFDEFIVAHHEICEQPEWIVDGMYFRTLYHRLHEADTIIFLDMPRSMCLWRVLKRMFFNYGKVTFSSAVHCPERFDWTFLKWVWNFNKRTRKSLTLLLDDIAREKRVYILRSKKEVQHFIEKLTQKGMA